MPELWEFDGVQLIALLVGLLTAWTMKYRDLIARIEAGGWYFHRAGKGGHMVYRHVSRPGSIVVAHGGKLNRDVPTGTENAVLRQAGLK